MNISNPAVLTSIKWPLDLYHLLNAKVEAKTFPNFSEAVRAYAQLGLRVESFKYEIKNPEFLKSIDELKMNDSIFEWLETLSQTQKEAISFAIQIDREKHVQQVKFV